MMLSIRRFHAFLFFLVGLLFAGSALALPTGVTSSWIGGADSGFTSNNNIADTTGCNASLCHGGVGAPPNTVILSGAAQSHRLDGQPLQTFTVPFGVTTTFTVSLVNPNFTSGFTRKAGYLLFHNDTSSNDAAGTLGSVGDPATVAHTCKTAVSPGGIFTGCPGTSEGWQLVSGPTNAPPSTHNGNTEVTHTTPVVGDASGNISFSFTYTPPAAPSCGPFPIRLWINAVNGDFGNGAPDEAAFYDFDITPNCADASVCTTDSCSAGVCQHLAITCPGADQCNSVAACNAITGCPAPVALTGIPCVTASLCDTGTVCQSNGSCGGGSAISCPTPDQCHSQGACIPATGCPPPAPLTGNTCNDGHACTNPDTCTAGVCGGPGISCPAPNECQTGGGCDDVSLGCLPVVSKVNGTLCGAVSFCSAGNVFHPHQTCTTGACGSPATTNCNGTCDPVTGCGGCNTDTDCLAGNYCDNTGTCAPFKATGTCNLASGAGGGDCKTAGCHECLTNNCVDGFCCNSACGAGSTTDCLACNVGGSQGICSPIAPGAGCNADSNLCTQNDACNAGGTCVAGAAVVCAAPQACQAAGVCQPGTGTCTYALLNGTVCAAAACQPDGITLHQTSTCNGALATCPAQVSTNCFPNPCVGGACTTGCTTDANCAAGAFCNGTICVAKKPIAGTCGGDNQCTSNHCADGVCCTAACSGQCEACDVAGSAGTCLPIAGTPHGTRAQCANDGTGCGGTCNGTVAASCAYPDNTKQCRADSCNAASNVATLMAGCNGAGACPAIQTLSCGNFVCGATQCNGDCMGDDTKCTATSFCAAGICQPKKTNGSPCGMPHECSSNQCVDGVCCTAVCNGQCQACDVAGNVGTCTTLPSGAPHGGRFKCDGSGACQASCDGASPTACTFPDATKLCGAPSCANETETPAAVCDSKGACTNPVMRDCSPYGCGVTGCRTACSSPLDCARGFDCIASNCVSPDATAPVPEASTPDSGTDGATPAPDASVVMADASTSDVSSGDSGAALPDAGAAGAAGNIGALPTAPEFEGGSCACRAAGGSMSNPMAALLPLLGLALAAARRRTERRRPTV